VCVCIAGSAGIKGLLFCGLYTNNMKQTHNCDVISIRKSETTESNSLKLGTGVNYKFVERI
jgi:hypothetical protein